MADKTDIAAFLTARLDEDEALAKATDPGCTEWDVLVGEFESGGLFNLLVAAEDGRVIVSSQGRLDDEEAAHIARHDPARVLRDVEAKRSLLAWAETYIRDGQDATGSLRVLGQAARQVLERLAAVYSDHPDYDLAWSTQWLTR